MKVEFDNMPDDARLWIYQAERKLNAGELKAISDALEAFTTQWAAHGQQLKSAFRVMYDQFIVLAVDESFNGASGCSIDGSARIVKQIESALGISLMDRSIVAFLVDNAVKTVQISELASGLQSGVWGGKTPTFNNLVPVKGKLASEWLVPAEETWLRKYLTKVTAF